MYWRCDEAAGDSAADSGPKKINAKLRGSAKFAQGKFGNGLQFEKQGDLAEMPNLALTGNAVTIALWVKQDDVSHNIQRYVTLGAESAVVRDDREGNLTFYMRMGGQIRFLHTADKTVPVGAWFHVAATWDGTTMRLYKDGVPAGSLKTAGVMTPITGGLLSTGDPESLIGTMDDVRVYARPLSDAEIQVLAGVKKP
jgi:hypothetical protein